MELLASTRLTGRRFSLKLNPGERTQAWMDGQIDGRTDSSVDTWGADEHPHLGQAEGTRRHPEGKAGLNRGWKCVIFLWEVGVVTFRHSQTLSRLIRPAFDLKPMNLFI